MSASKRKPKEPQDGGFPPVVRMGEIPKETLKENGYVWVASRKLWVKK